MMVSPAHLSTEPLVTWPPSTSHFDSRSACGYGPQTSLVSTGASTSAMMADDVPETSETTPSIDPPQASSDTWASMPPTATGGPPAMPSSAATAEVRGPATDPTGRISSGSFDLRSPMPSAS